MSWSQDSGIPDNAFDITPDDMATGQAHDPGRPDDGGPPNIKMIAATVIAFVVAIAVIVGVLRGPSPNDRSATSTPQTSAAEPTTDRATGTTLGDVHPIEVFPTLPPTSGPVRWAIAPTANPLSGYGMSVRSLVGAQPGFVVVADVAGFTFDAPLWTSTDGLTWTAVNAGVFDGYVATTVVGTADTIFVQASDATRAIGADRTGAERLYRSTDLDHWVRVDDDFVGDLTAAGDSFITRVNHGALESSRDGTIWTPVPNSGQIFKSSVQRFGDDGVIFVVTEDDVDRSYLTPDGATAIPLPPRPLGASYVTTPSGVVTITNPARPDCEPQLQMDLADNALDLGPQLARSIYQQCLADSMTFVNGPAGWVPTARAATPHPTVTHPQLVRLGDQLIAVVTDANFSLQLWTAPVDNIVWESSQGVIPGEALGLPREPWVATDGDRVVVIPSNYEYENRIPVVVGTLSES